jgi:elongation factor P
MSQMDQLRKGMVIRHEGHLLTIEDYKLAQTGKQKATVHVKLRSLRDGHSVERSLDELGKIEEVPTEIRTMQYLYASGSEHVFMDTETFEQYPLGDNLLSEAKPFLVEEENYRFLSVDENIASIHLPDVVVLEVVDTAPVQHVGGSVSVQKDAKLNSGLTIHVPLFIKNGDKVRVSTESRQYLGKEKEH